METQIVNQAIYLILNALGDTVPEYEKTSQADSNHFPDVFVLSFSMKMRTFRLVLLVN